MTNQISQPIRRDKAIIEMRKERGKYTYTYGNGNSNILANNPGICRCINCFNN